VLPFKGIMEILHVMRLRDTARLPSRESPLSAGWDLYSDQEAVLEPGSRALIGTGLVVAVVEPGHYARIAPRSGLAAKRCIDIGAGVVDTNYRGELFVLLVNNGTAPQKVEPGDCVAQLIVEAYHAGGIVEVTELEGVERDDGRFGSLGH
jgi:dUTP pyrophosphatase